MALVAFGSFSKSSVLDCSLIGPFRSLLYFSILLTEGAATIIYVKGLANTSSKDECVASSTS